MNSPQEYLTKEKHDELQKELSFLKSTKRKEIAEGLEYAKSLGDLSENQEYQEVRDAQALVEDRINRLEAMLKSAVIVSAVGTGAVAVGSAVTLERVSDHVHRSFTIVGSEETDALSGKISLKSPLGSAIMGKKKGETFSFESPSGMMSYKIIDIK
ncbi:MAG: transcription elongation factor GreA [Patescibacteria group bacterium]